MKKSMFTGVIFSLVLVLALNGCMSGNINPVNNPTPSFNNTPSPDSTITPVLTGGVTPSPDNTSASSPTHTPVATKTSTPTNTPTPAKTNTPTHTPAPTSTVIPTTSPVLRIVNNTKYYMVDIKLNGVEQIYYPYVIEAGDYWDFTFTTGGTVTYYLGVGFYDSNGYPDVWFELQGTTTVSAGNIATITCNNPSLQQLLTGFSSSGYAYWYGDYWYNLTPYYKTLKFYSSGAWELYDNGTYVGSGSVILTSWPNYSNFVSFKLSPTGSVITMAYPFGDFYYKNGPSGWETIQYFRQ